MFGNFAKLDSPRRLIQFWQNLQTSLVLLIPNCTRQRMITYTNKLRTFFCRQRNNDELILDQELAKTNKVRIPIISDGHCIVRVVYKALTLESNYPLKSYEKLLHCACNEIEDKPLFLF